MSLQFGNCSIMKEITQTEDTIKSCYERVALLEQRLQSGNFPQGHKKTVETELQECRKLLSTNKKLLSNLHKHNTNSFVLGIAFCLIIFLVWMLYILVKGDSF